MESSRNDNLISFKLHAVLGSIMKSCVILFCTAQDMNHLLLSSVSTLYCSLPTSHFIAALVIRSIVSAVQCLCSGNPYSSLTLSHGACVTHLISSCRHCVISHHHDKDEYSTIRYFGRKIYITLQYCCNYVLLLVIVVNLLPCLIYKLIFIIDMYV